ncbi:hypothetical protein BH11PLA2_BH11PLA2_25230 [soil metagenome]
MRRLTLSEVNEQHGGILPTDAVLRADDEPARPAAKAKPPRRNGRGERFTVLNAFADVALANLTGAEAKVWLILFRDTKAATGTARTGQSDLARRAGLTVRGVQKALVKLQRRELLRITRRGRLNAGPSTYRVSA